MADLSEIQAAIASKIIGSDSFGGELTPVRSTTAGALEVNLRDASGNELSVIPVNSISNDLLGVQITGQQYNQIEINFETTANPLLITNTTTSTGTISIANGHSLYSTGTGVTSSAKGVSVQSNIYRPLHQIYAGFTAAFTTPTSANSYQRIGLYDFNNGFFIGFNGLNFGVTKRTATVDTFVNRTSFNTDLLDGSTGSKFTRDGVSEAINLNYSNLFRIRFAWLGSASILFEVFSPDGEWVVYHTIKQPNSALNPSINSPNLPMTLDVSKTSADTTNLIIYTACWAAGTSSSLVKITDNLTDYSLASVNKSVIVGHTTGGGIGAPDYVNVKVNPSGALTVESTVTSSALPTGAATETTLNKSIGASSGGTQGALTMTTAGTVYEAKVDVSALSLRTILTVSPTTADVYWGWTNTVTTTSGTKIPNNSTAYFDLNPASAAQVFLVSGSGSVNVRITEAP